MVLTTCHGNPHAVRAIVAALGVREVHRAFVLDRAVARRRLDRTRAEAMLLLPDALTGRAARMLSDQAGGALARAARRLRRPSALASTAAVGCALAAPRRVAIVGRPNAGKSTLFNAMVEHDRALVSPQAHTTRDPVVETIAIDGVPLALVDTAGLGPGGAIEALSAERTSIEVSRADLVLRLDDTPVPARRVLDVHAKADLAPAPRGTLGVCAPSGEGLDRLRRAILRALALDVPLRPGAPCIFTERQCRALASSRWRESLLWGDRLTSDS